MIIPISQVITSKVFEDIYKEEKASPLKYLIFNNHDLNLNNFLRFIGYWEKYGYTKHVQFGSSIRLELIKAREENKTMRPSKKSGNELNEYLIRIVYDH